MWRMVALLVGSLLVSTVVTALLPAWKTHILAPGDERVIDLWKQGIEITVRSRAEDGKYLDLKDEVEELKNAANLITSPGTVVRQFDSDAKAQEIWWRSSGRNPVSYHAPGAVIWAWAKVQAGRQGGDTLEVRWSGPAYRRLMKAGTVTIRWGNARQDGDTLLLARYQVAALGAERFWAVTKGAVLGGAPLAVILVALGLFFLKLREAPVPVREQPAALPMQFEKSVKAAQVNYGVFAGILSVVLLTIGICSLSFAISLIDLPGLLVVNGWIGVAGGLVVWLILAGTRMTSKSVLLEPDHIEVRTGPSEKLKFNVPWSEIQSVYVGQQRRRRGVLTEWLVLRSTGGRRISIGAGQVQEYELLKQKIFELVPEGARPG